jgi:hypothetical protein
MKVKLPKITSNLPPKGVYNAQVKSIDPAGEKKVEISFLLTNYADGTTLISSKYVNEMQAGSSLRSDIVTIRGKEISLDEDEFDFDTVVGMKCQVLLDHRKGSGGKWKPAIKGVLAAAEANEETVSK